MEEKYMLLCLYLNANEIERGPTAEKYQKVMGAFEGDSLCEEIARFHLLRESFINLRELVPQIEEALRMKIPNS